MTKINKFFTVSNVVMPANQLNFKLGLISLILNRSLLIEDVPGMGKTTFVKVLARAFSLKSGRIQFTSDLLPSDILGVSVFNKDTNEFVFKRGPIFNDLILADELNRGTPKVQSALLEALEEKQVSIDGVTYPLSDRFCLMATQNPRGQFGTYPLPESQLDRFLFKTTMGKLTRDEEMGILRNQLSPSEMANIEEIADAQDLKEWSLKSSEVTTSDNILNYILDIVELTRTSNEVSGLSPRAVRDLVDASKVLAFINDRTYVIPDDVQELFPYVSGHRLYNSQIYSVNQEHAKALEIIKNVKVRPE